MRAVLILITIFCFSGNAYGDALDDAYPYNCSDRAATGFPGVGFLDADSNSKSVNFEVDHFRMSLDVENLAIRLLSPHKGNLRFHCTNPIPSFKQVISCSMGFDTFNYNTESGRYLYFSGLGSLLRGTSGKPYLIEKGSDARLHIGTCTKF